MTNVDNYTYLVNRITSLTPELSSEERITFFGSRTESELQDICDLFFNATQIQRHRMYIQLYNWAGDMAANN